jgi:hypothetical protein
MEIQLDVNALRRYSMGTKDLYNLVNLFVFLATFDFNYL